MEGRGNLIAAIILIIVVLAVVLGTILYLGRSIGGKVNLIPNLNIFSRRTPIPSFAASASASASVLKISPSSQVTNQALSNTPRSNLSIKEYSAKGFKLQYPVNWGVVTCTTSANFEFDPYNSVDQTIPCNTAIKPITVLVDQGVSCRGELVKLGSHQVYRSKIQYRDWFTNEWCFNEAGHNIDITNRIANSSAAGTGKDDFSSQIEQMIAGILN